MLWKYTEKYKALPKGCGIDITAVVLFLMKAAPVGKFENKS